jgi:hypothetical protein
METSYDQRYRIFITNDSDKGKQQEQLLQQLLKQQVFNSL